MRDHREHRRAPIRLQLNYRDATGGNFLFEYSRNISKGGIFIETPHPLPSGALLVMRFQVPGTDQVIEVDGEVVWVNPFRDGDENPNPGMGIQFRNLNEDHHDIIAGIVKAIAILPE
jgi:uncharacterized protein (TIGR02266 family)